MTCTWALSKIVHIFTIAHNTEYLVVNNIVCQIRKKQYLATTQIIAFIPVCLVSVCAVHDGS